MTHQPSTPKPISMVRKILFWIVVPLEFMFVVTVASLIGEGEFGTALVGLFSTVLPLGWFLCRTVVRWHEGSGWRSEQDALAARAEFENDMFLKGDPRGLYGQYGPWSTDPKDYK